MQMIKMKQQDKLKEYVQSLKWSYFGLIAGFGLVVLVFSTTSVFLMWAVGTIGTIFVFINGVQMTVTINNMSRMNRKTTENKKKKKRKE